MKPRHAAVLALAGWYLLTPNLGLAAGAKSKLDTYTNQKYRFSLRYPSDWTLEEGEGVSGENLHLDGFELDDDLPRDLTRAKIAAIEPPADLHPGELGVLVVSVEAGINAKECGQFATATPKPGPVNVGATQFVKAEDGSLGLGHQFSADYYHVFRNGVCFEFKLAESANMAGIQEAVEEGNRKANDPGVDSDLMRALSTLSFNRK